MAYSPKLWRNKPDGSTPLSAEALIDLETRLTNYADAQAATKAEEADLAAEATSRAAGDGTLSTAISAEATARDAAITAQVGAEATTRSGADTALGTRVTTLESEFSALPGLTNLIHVVTVAPAGTPADFNTDGTDDHVEIEAAIAALPAAGGEVRVQGSMTLGRDLQLSKTGVTLQGEGIASALKLASSADSNVITVTGDDVTIDGFKLDGNRANIELDHHGVSVSAARCRLSRLFILETVHHGIQCSNSTDIEIDHVWVQNTGKVGSNRDGVGIVIGGGQGPCIGARVSNCRVFSTGYHGFQVYRGSQHVSLVNCQAEKVGQTRDAGNALEIHPNTLDVHVSQFVGLGTLSGANGAGIVVDSEVGSPPARMVVLHSCMIEGHALNGIVVNGASDVTITACQIKNNGRLGTSSNKHGIRIRNGSASGDVPSRLHVFGCHIFDDQASGAKTQADPIGVYDGATDVAIYGNTFYGHLTTDIVVIDASSTGVVSRFMNTGDRGPTAITQYGRPARLVDVEPTVAPYGFDQVTVPAQPQADGATATVIRDTARSYEGSAALKCSTTSSGPSAGTAYARGHVEIPTTGPTAFRMGDDFWCGAAFYLPAGFYAAKTNSVDLMRLDAYVDDAGTLRDISQQQSLAVELFGDDTMHVLANDRNGIVNDLLVTAVPPGRFPEGQWNWLALHVRLGASAGAALTELYVNGQMVGGSDRVNCFATRAMFNRLRWGIVSTGPGETGSFDLWVDRAWISALPLPPVGQHLAAPGHQLMSGTVLMPQRAALKFSGAGVAVADDLAGGATTVTISGSAATSQADLDTPMNLPTGAKKQTVRRAHATSSVALGASGRLQLAYLGTLKAGVTYSSVRLRSATTAGASLTHRWACLVRVADRAVLAKSGDDTSAAWNTDTAQVFTFATPYTPAGDEEVMVGVVVVGTTLPTLRGVSGATNIFSDLPMEAATADNALTDPTSLGGTAAAFSGTNVIFYASVA